MTSRRPRSGQTGVTLLEVVISLAILSVMALVVTQVLRFGTQAWDKGEKRAEVEQRVRAVYGMLVHDLASVLPVSLKIEGKPVTAFRGGPEWILFHSAPDGHGVLPYGAMVKSRTYAVEPGRGLFLRESYPLVEGEVSLDPRGIPRLVDSGVARLGFRYLAPPGPGDSEPSWVETWDPREALEVKGTAGPSSRRQGLPLAVEVTIVMAEDRGSRGFGFLLPIRAGGTL